jgi:hypothetical protein
LEAALPFEAAGERVPLEAVPQEAVEEEVVAAEVQMTNEYEKKWEYNEAVHQLLIDFKKSV